jgi:sortase A
MKNRNIKKVIPYVLIISGIIIIAIALYQKISTTYYQNKLVDEYYKYISRLNFDDNIEVVVPLPESPSEESAAASREHEEERAEEPEIPKEPDENPVEKYLQGKEISGIIEIPKLGVKAAILEGTDDTALKYTVGHYPGTGNPGKKGNYVLLGHRNYVYGHYFRRIDELKPGDEVVIKKDLETYTYTITESFVVSPEEVWVLEDTEEIMLTMITCTPVITYTDRLIVRGVISEQ